MPKKKKSKRIQQLKEVIETQNREIIKLRSQLYGKEQNGPPVHVHTPGCGTKSCRMCGYE